MSAVWNQLTSKTALLDISGGPTHEEQIIAEFRLPEGEHLLSEIHAEFVLEGSQAAQTTMGGIHAGSLYLTTSRVERLAGKTYQFNLGLTTWHRMKLVLQLIGLRHHNEDFCDFLKKGLQEQLPSMKALKPFLAGCWSEFLLAQPRGEEPRTGMGMVFHFPGDPKKSKDKSKIRLWKEYLSQNGRNLTLIRFPTLSKLVRVGLPNQLRGEIWEATSGAILSRWIHPGEYETHQMANAGRNSISLDEIEKDLNRSLPEYPAYQENNIGIAALRRVLSAYSWKNPELGYCQAMNIVVAALLIYTTEEQSFWLLHTLCTDMLPGYYSTTMYGTLLDQRVFEALVEKTMPVLWEHFVKADVQLSVVSLPWFLSLYINSMPLVLAFRVLDCFFLEGPRVLFQVGLAILRVNGEQLMGAADDGTFIEILKRYFSTLDESAHPKSSNPKLKAVTRFQELIVVAFKEFAMITHESVLSERNKYKNTVLTSIEDFARRTQIRALRYVGKLTKEELSIVYDRFHTAIYKKRVGFGGTKDMRMGYDAFRSFMAGVAPWARDPRGDHHFMARVFGRWDTEMKGSLSLDNVVCGVAALFRGDLMDTISWWFELFDRDGDGKLDKDEVLQVSEAFLWILRLEPDDRYLTAVSSFIQNCFYYAEKGVTPNLLNLDGEGQSDGPDLFITLPTFRMVILADDALENFFADRFIHSIIITPQKESIVPCPTRGLRGMLDAIVTDGTKLAVEIKRRVDELDEDTYSGSKSDMDAVLDQLPKQGDRDLLKHMDVLAP